MATIELRSLSKRFGATEVIPRIDLTIPDGRVTVLLGPSGCGKSTLLRMIAGLETPSDGEICIDGAVVNQVAPSKRGCAMVFQNYALYPNKTVRHNLSFPLRMAKVPQAEQDRLVERTAHTLELTPLLDRFPRQLSGGQRQRVAMGRAMIRQPKVFLYDEPLSNLDLELRVKLRMEIARMQKSLKATAVYVTHDQTEAMTLADQIVVLRKGHIEQVGAPLDLYRKPVNLFVAGFIGTPRINLFAVDSVQYNGTATKLRMGAGGIEVQRRFTTAPKWVGFRPEQVSWATANPGQVVFALNDCETQGVEHLGDRAFCYLSSHMGEVVVLARSAEEQFSGSLRIAVDESALHFFGEDGVALV